MSPPWLMVLCMGRRGEALAVRLGRAMGCQKVSSKIAGAHRSSGDCSDSCCFAYCKPRL